MKAIKHLPIALLGLAMTGCMNDDQNVQEISCYWPEGDVSNITYVTDPDGNSHVYEASNLSFTYRIDQGTVGITALSIPLTDERRVNFVLPEQKYNVTNYNVYSVAFTGPVSGNNITLTDFNVGAAIRYVDTSLRTRNYFYANMTIDGYRVSVIQTSNIYFGETKVNSVVGDPTTYTDQQTYYEMELDSKTMTAKITINNAKFASDMPTQTKITLPDVPVTLTHNGIHFHADEITPLQSNGSPKPEYMITDLTGDAGQGKGLQLTFTVKDTWCVNAQCGYYASAL